MYASLLDESRLVDGHDVGQARREAVGHELGEDLHEAVDEANEPEVPNGGRISLLRHKNNVCRIDEAGHVPARIRQGVDGQPEVVLGISQLMRKNLPMKPSGPGAFSAGRSKTAVLISSKVKGASRA